MTHGVQQLQLEAGALGLSQAILMGVAGTAPAFTIAASTVTLIASVGTLSAASLLYCGLIMFGVTLTFMHFNRVITNAGASYAWVHKVFHPALGFLAGWSLLVASAVFMVSGTIPAATATLTLIDPHLATLPGIVTMVAAGWLLLVSTVVAVGIRLTSYAQVVMTAIEIGILLIIIVAAILHAGQQPVHPFSTRWLAPTEFTPTLFAGGALTALFFFWGWDVTLNLNEETRDAACTSGRAAAIAMIVVLLMFMGFVVTTLLLLSDAEIEQSGTNVVFALATKLFPKPWSYMAIVAVMLSSLSALVTTILGFTRTMFAMSRDGALHPRYAALHPSWRTPWAATGVIAVLGLAMLFMSSYFPTIDLILKDSINAIGLQIAFYYSVTSFACAWYFRKRAFAGVGPFLFLLLWPLASACFLVFIAIYSISTLDLPTSLVGIGGIAIGVVPLLLNHRNPKKQVAAAGYQG